MANEEIDYKLAAEQLRTGKPLFGKDGALAPMLERILNAALIHRQSVSERQSWQKELLGMYVAKSEGSSSGKYD